MSSAFKDCKFCQLIHDEKSEKYVVFEDDDSLAMLDVRPLFLGHSLLMPKLHYQTLYDLPAALVKTLFLHAQKIGTAIEKSMAAEGSFIGINNIVSQSIPHLHIHIVPRKKGDGLKGFFWPRTNYQNCEEMHEIQEKIKKCL